MASTIWIIPVTPGIPAEIPDELQDMYFQTRFHFSWFFGDHSLFKPGEGKERLPLSYDPNETGFYQKGPE